jgi:hypothetical protein
MTMRTKAALRLLVRLTYRRQLVETLKIFPWAEVQGIFLGLYIGDRRVGTAHDFCPRFSTIEWFARLIEITVGRAHPTVDCLRV